MKQFIARAAIMVMAWGAVLMLALTINAVISFDEATEQQVAWTFSQPMPERIPIVYIPQVCLPQALSTVPVGGLNRDDVPRLSEAWRLNYETEGQGQYLTRDNEKNILNYYLPELAAQCWEISSIEPGQAIWQKEGQILKIALAENPLGGKTLVDYQLTGQVLGVEFNTAIDETATCASDQMYCPGVGCYSNTGICPPPTDSTTNPAESTSACPADQYMCNNSCIANGTSCNNYPYINPGVPTTDQSCGQCKVRQDEKCVLAPAGTQDAACNGGVCDAYGGCVILTGDKTYVGQGAICGDGMCDNGKGESSGNCSRDCGAPPAPAGSQNGQGQYNQSPMVPGGQGQMMGQGPSEEELQKMDARRFQDMKKGLKQFTNSIKQMEKMVKKMEPKLAKLGVGMPVELKAAVAKAPEIIAKITNAKTADELDELTDEIQDIGDTMQEWGPQIGNLTRLGEMLKRANTELKNIQKSVVKIEKYLKKNPALQDVITAVKTVADEMKKALDEAKELAKTEPDSALDKLETEFYDRMEEFWNGYSEVEMIQNLAKGITQAKREVKTAETKIKSLEKSKKVDAEIIAELKNIIAQIKEKITEIQELSKAQPKDIEMIKDATEELWSLFEDLENIFAEEGQGNYSPQIKSGENVNFVRPDAFDFSQPSGGNQGGYQGLMPIQGGSGSTGPTCNINGVETPGTCAELQGNATP